MRADLRTTGDETSRRTRHRASRACGDTITHVGPISSVNTATDAAKGVHDTSATGTRDRGDGATPNGERHPVWLALFLLGALVPLAHAVRLGEFSWVAGGLLLAAVPFAGTLALVGLLQFRRARPWASRRWALLWGLLVATGASSYVNGLLGGGPEWRTVVLLAPVVEELAKGVGLLLLARFGRVRNPVDGIVYALLIGGGFSLVENTFYFFNAISAELGGNDGVLQDVFVMRGLVAPLAHPIFAAALGVTLGTRYGRRPLVLLAALGSGIALHALWNHAAVSGVVTNLVPHTVALTLALAAAALLRAHRESGDVGERPAPQERDLEERHDGAARVGTTITSWYAALPWYEQAAGTPARTTGQPPDKTRGARTVEDPGPGNVEE